MNSFQSILCLCLFVLISGLSVDCQQVNDVSVTNKTLGIKYQDKVCVLMYFELTNVSVIFNNTKTVGSYVAKFDEWKVKPERSYCEKPDDNTTQSLTLVNNGNYLTFDFELQNWNTSDKMVQTTYNLTSITFEWQNTEVVNNTLEPGAKMSIEPDLKLKKSVKSGTGVECKERYVFLLNTTKDMPHETRLAIQGIKFSAFRNNNSTDLSDDKTTVCDISKKAKPGNDTIPIAVGGVLTGILVISLIGYLVIRARKS